MRKRRFILSIALLSIVAVCGNLVFAQSMQRAERWAIAQSAYEVGDWDTVDVQSAALLDRWPKDEVALLLRAKMFIFSPKVDANEAERLLGNLPRSVRNSTDVKGLSLWIDYNHGGGFLSSFKLIFQQRRANKILEVDAQNPLANLVAGSIKLDDYRDQYASVRLPIDMDLDAVIGAMGTVFASGDSFINTEGRSNAEIPVVRDESLESETSDEAVKLLLRAAEKGPLRSIALRKLFETTLRRKDYDLFTASAKSYIASFPTDALGYLGLGLSYFFQGHVAEAAVQLEKGSTLMDSKGQWAMNSPAQIASSRLADQYSATSEAANIDYWARMDHFWSSPINERLVEHRARVVYADLIWGRPDRGLQGWETEPGSVIVRYGWPKMEMQFQDAEGQYYYLDYGYRYWLFLDLFKSEDYTVWSPPGGSTSASRLCDRGRGGVDMERCSKEWFRDDPQRTQRSDVKRVEMQSLASVFEDGDARTVVIPFCFPSTDQIPGRFVTIFDRKTGNPVPRYGISIALEEREKHWSEMPCEVAQVVAQQVDNDAGQLSVEIEGLTGFAVNRIEIPAVLDENHFRVSDLLLARLIEETDSSIETDTAIQSDQTSTYISRNGTIIYPVARPVFSSGTPIFLYLESYGLSAEQSSDLSFQAALISGTLDQDLSPQISRIFGSKEKAVVSVEFSQIVHSPVDSRYFILETTDVSPGSYVIAVRVVEKRTGSQQVISREIVIN